MAAFLPSAAQAAGEIIPLIDYNGYPPIVVDVENSKGMLWDLADLLCRRSAGKYQFVAAEMPRRRLDIQIQAGDRLVVPFVDPGFFGDPGMTKYFWTRAMFEDRQEIISPADKPIDYSGPDSLAGLVFGGVFGRIYGPLEDAFRSGKIVRSDALDEMSNLLKVSTGRVAVGSISSLALGYYRQIDGRTEALHISSQPLYPIKRRIMVVGGAAPRDFIDAQLQDIGTAEDWRSMLGKYGQ
jgi:polar amino acid transport system substrate-binding protein